MIDYGLVSIITPCYNAELCIEETIQSVLSQTYLNWELLICDDCSTDQTVEIILQYCQRDSRIKLFKTNQNTGSPSQPRNIALDAAHGDYLAFLDADDVWYPRKLEEQLDFMIGRNVDFVYSNYEKMNYVGQRRNRMVYVRSKSTYWDMLESDSIPCLTALIKKEYIGNVRFRLLPKEDYEFWLEIMRVKSLVAYNTNQVHAIYRESKNSRSGNKFAMIRKQWYILRQIEHVKRIPASYFMVIYLVKGFLKYIK